MIKRYQVFLSSTYADLKEERNKVIQTLMEMDCIPAGMELFPAIDEEQFEFIKKIIDDCDYYVLIIGGRYGSLTNDGISYTEKEYDYAINRGLKVLAFIHENPGELAVNKSDIDPEIREKLKIFREKVADGRLVKFWNNSAELPGLLALSLSKTIKMHPAVGWVRGTQSSNEEILNDINDLRKENDKMKEIILSYEKESKPKLDNLASLDDKISIKGKKYNSAHKSYYPWDLEITWSKIFELLAPYLLEYPSDSSVKSKIGDVLYSYKSGSSSSAYIDDQDFQTIKIQFSALNLIDVRYNKTTKGGMDLFWYLLPAGKNLMLELRTIKAK